MAELVTRAPGNIERKIKAVGLSGLIVPIVGGFIASQFPGLSEACGGEISAGVTAWALLQAQGATDFISGYMTKSNAG